MSRIIIENRFGHWSAWFADHPESAFGGDTEETAIRRLQENRTENTNAKAGICGPDLASK